MRFRVRPAGRLLLVAGVLVGLLASRVGFAGGTRRLGFDLRSKWAILFQQIVASHGDWKLRAKLAACYNTAGYTSAARFLLHRPGSESVTALAQETRAESSVWSCGDNPAALAEVWRKAQRIEESVRGGRYGPAREETLAALKTFGPACPLLVEWAQITLYSAMATNGDSADSEAAVRILITGVEDLNVKPISLLGSADVYEFLSQYFCSVHDDVSCASALDFAIAGLDRIPAIEARYFNIEGWRARLEADRKSVLERLQRH